MSATVDPIAAAATRARALESLPEPNERRRIREAAGVPIAAVADALSVSRAAVSRWEAGQRLPAGELAEQYAAVLDRLRGLAPQT